MEPINFYLGDESRLVIEDFKSKKESLFKDSYDKALDVIYDFIQDSKKNKSEVDKDGASVFFRQTADSVKNNVVAFLGDRGTGKTSCMLSVANMLRKINSCENDEKGEKIKSLCEKGFEILETIDPSFFDEKANVLEVVLGRLFSNFRKKVDDGYTQDFKEKERKKNELFKTFQEVKECLTHMNADKCVCEEDTAEGLLKLTASVDMRNSIENLVEDYLEFVGRDYLVISIDDIDMHTEHAYEMAEEIRKYLKQPKIIVLMALKLEQLEQTIEFYFNKIMSEKIVPKSTIVDMALKYVIKLIPENNRIHLPSVSMFADREVNVYRKSENGEGKKYKGYHWLLVNKNRDDDKSEDHSYQTLKYYVTSLIFRKTRYLFYHFQGKISPIVPSNLRELRFLIEMLNNMDDYTKKNKFEYNKEKFKEYFLTIWAENNLSVDGCVYLKRFFKIKDTANINKFVLKAFQEIYKDLFEIVKENTDKITLYDNVNRICNDRNRSCNISLGDVLLVRNLLKSLAINEIDKMFFFAVETFYSMRLYEFYDRITEYREPENMDKYVDEKIKKRDALDGYHDYEILIGCNFIHLFNNHIYQDVSYNIIEINKKSGKKEEKKKSYGVEFRQINYEKVLKYWNEIKDLNEYDDVSLTKLHFVEFFVLCLSYKVYDSYRLVNTVALDSPIDKKQKYIWFDLLAFFANVIDAEKHYNRVDENLYKKVINEPKSLYRKIKEYCEQKRTLMSYVSIRNVEILDDFEEYLRKKKNNLNGYPDEFSKIQKVVRDIISYEMMTYDPGEDANTRFSVNFKFFEEIAKIFEEPGAKEIFDDIYNSVPNEKNDLIKEAELEKIIARVVGKTGRTVRSAFKTYFEKYYYKLADFDKVVLENACPNGMKINSESDVYELLKKITNGLRAKESDLQVKAIDKKPSVKIETKASNKQVKVNREKKSKIAVPKVKVLKKTKKK
jgi:hypothetical protein